MMHVYIGLADGSGLRTFLPESDTQQRRLMRQAESGNQQVAVWSVLDSEALVAIQQLLEIADYRSAWRYLQSHSAHFGRLI